MDVGDITTDGKKQNIVQMLKVPNTEVDLGEPTSFVDHVYLGCTQRQCQISKNTVDNYRTMFDSRISGEGLEKLQFPQNLRFLARSITKWTKACDKRLNRLISYNHHKCEW